MAAAIVFQATDTDNGTITGTSSYTFTLTVASAVGQERLVAVGLICSDSGAAPGTLSGVTVDGQAATLLGAKSNGAAAGGALASLSFWRASGTAGTSISVIATKSSSASDFFGGCCAVWSLNDADTLLATTATATAVTDPTLNTDTATDGGAVAAMICYDTSGGATAWSGLTEDFDAVKIFSNDLFTGASASISSGTTPRSISADVTPNSNTSCAAVCVSFNPVEEEEPAAGGQVVSFGYEAIRFTRTIAFNLAAATPTVAEEAETTAWAAAVVGAGGSVSSGRRTLVNELIVGLKDDGVWNLLDRLWLFAAENSQSALRDIVAAAAATAVNSPSFSADDGYTGNGTTSYVATNFDPSAGGTNFTLNSGHLGVHLNTLGSSSSKCEIGCFSGSNILVITNLSGTLITTINDSSALFASSSGAGTIISSRTASNARAFYRNGSSIGSDSQTTAAIPGVILFAGARNDGSTGDQFSDDQIAAAFVGGGLDATQAGNLRTRIQTYMTAVGL